MLKDGGITSEKVGVISTDHKTRKAKEFDKYMPMIQKMKVDLCKLLMAKDVSYHVHQSDQAVTDLFASLDKQGAFKGDNGNSYEDEKTVISR